MPHQPISPAILYWGTPVVLITTLNPDLTPNIGTMSSAFWLGNRSMLGIAAHSQTTLNLLRTGECVLNLASATDDMAAAVNRLARTTGSEVVPARKQTLGYRYVKDKFGVAGLTPLESTVVGPPRIQQCPVHMEARLVGHHVMNNDVGESPLKGFMYAIEVEVLRTFVEEGIRMEGYPNRVDPDKWKPMIMNFQKLYGVTGEQLVESKLAEIDEEFYRGPGPSR